MCTKNGNLMGNMTINQWIGIAYVQGKKHLVHKVGGAGHQLLKGSDHPTFFAPSIQIYLAPQGTLKKNAWVLNSLCGAPVKTYSSSGKNSAIASCNRQ